MIKKIIKTIFAILAVFILADVSGFVAWVMSGQSPSGGFYVGAITARLLRFLLG